MKAKNRNVGSDYPGSEIACPALCDLSYFDSMFSGQFFSYEASLDLSSTAQSPLTLVSLTQAPLTRRHLRSGVLISRSPNLICLS